MQVPEFFFGNLNYATKQGLSCKDGPGGGARPINRGAVTIIVFRDYA